jgi:osmoprotectant transport system permease protein
LLAAAAAAAVSTGFIGIAANRLADAKPIALFAAEPRFAWAIAGLGIALLGATLLPSRRFSTGGAVALAAALVLLIPAAAGRAAAEIAAASPALARVSLGPAFWIMFGAAALALVDSMQRAGAGIAASLLVAVAITAAFALLFAAGAFDALSVVREYHARREVFAAALGRHLVLVAAAVGPAVAIGMPLAITALRRPFLQTPLFATLNLLQTIPSIALFGLLLAPLSGLAAAFPGLAALGIGGIGMAPAIIALVLYALLPVARNVLAGLAGVDPTVIDAARGMGMTARQIFWRVELPLAAPLLLAGLRIVIVQTIGLAVVAALIGAGGLGSLVFEGLGQDAADLVLLGALPAIALALAANFVLQAASAAVRR